VIHRILAVSLAVLIALPFTAPFALFDLRDSSSGSHVAATLDTVTAPALDDGLAWSDRSGRHHHAMPLAAFNSGYASLDLAFLYTPLPPSAVTSVPHSASVIATVLRV
jgi:hypothetical protein